MSASSTRSLVLVIFILASHISDALAGHHHIKLRHERHRRQHSNSFLPASFVLDTNEEETGTWGPWSMPSSCSRSCGGGVAHQFRSCHDLADDGSERCTGSKRRFFSCNIEKCPDPTKDYRAEQCSAFNNQMVGDSTYEWIPYTGSANKCGLNCMPVGERFWYHFNNTVMDGTLCSTEGNDICVEGKCMPVGCDMMLGSGAKEDKCRECGGDGSGCNTNQGLFADDLPLGYNDILLIPKGATNIAINEIRPSNNYLAIRNGTGHYYLNGNWKIDFPQSLRFAGTVFHYERRPRELSAADIIKALGPISEAIYIVMLYQDKNVGVEYEYSIPHGLSSPSDPDSYTWIANEFPECSVSCGGGKRSRLVRCVRRRDSEVVDDHLCDQLLKPDGTESCGEEPCAPGWRLGDWGPCNKKCGPNGEQTREIKCEQIISRGIPSLVDDYQCLQLIGPKDIEIRSCNTEIACPNWHIGPWKPCDRLCGKGKERRQVICYKKEGGKIFVLPDSECEGERVESEKTCNLRPCSPVDWVTSEWSGCDNKCGLTQETRTTRCVSLDDEVYPEEVCNLDTKPGLVRECMTQEKCKFQWHASQWSECSAKCGTGIQTRKVFCGTSFPGSDCVTKVEKDKCDPTTKYNDTKDCIAEFEECKGEWFAGIWSECSKPCGVGDMSRVVICMKDNKLVSPEGNCYGEDIIFSKENCNTHACEEDHTISPDTKRPITPAEDEEECKEYGEDEDDGFVYDDSSFQLNDFGDVPPLRSPFNTESFDNYLMMGDEPADIPTRGDQSFTDEGGSGSFIDYEHLTDSQEGSGSETTDSTEYSSFTTSFFTSDSTYETESMGSSETSDTDITGFTDTPSGSTVTDAPKISSTTKVAEPLTPMVEIPADKARAEASPSIEEIEKLFDTDEDPTTAKSGSDSTTSENTGTTSSSVSTNVSDRDSTGETTISAAISTDTTDESSYDTTESPDSETTPSSSETMISSSSQSTVSSSETEASSSSDATESVNTDITAPSSSSGVTESTSGETTGSSGSETTTSSSSDLSSTDATISSSGSEATELSSSESTVSSSETIASSSPETTESLGTDLTGPSSSSGVPESTSEETTGSSGSETTASSSSDLSSTDATISSSGSEATELSSSASTVFSSETTASSSPETTESLGTDLTGPSSSLEVTESTSGETTGSSGSETTTSSSSDLSSTDATISSSGSEATELSSSESTVSRSETTASSSPEATESLGTDLTGPSSSLGTTESTSEETTGSSGSETTTSSSSDLSSTDATISSSGSEATELSSSKSTVSSLETTTSSSPETTESLGTDLTGTSSSLGVTESTSGETTGSSGPETTELSSSDLSSTDATISSSGSEATELSSSESTIFSSETTASSSPEATESLGTDLTGPSSSLGITESTSGETTGSSGSETTTSSSSDLSSTDATVSSSGSEATELSSSKSTESSLETTASSSSETTVSPFGSETTPISSPESTVSTSETKSSSSTEATVSSSSLETASSSPSSETTVSSISTDVTESSSTETSEKTTETGTEGTSEPEFITETWETTFSGESITTMETGVSSETTESGITETDEDLDTTGQSHITDIWTPIDSTTHRPRRKCKPRKIKKTCKSSPFGCCYDGIKAATGPFGKGCVIPKTCQDVEFGCCPDGVSPANGPNYQGCPESHCSEMLFGCCKDDVTPAQGNDYEGCPIPCIKTEFGCCPDGKTPAAGADNLGCCNVTKYGCCPDGIEAASGPDEKGCKQGETSTATTVEVSSPQATTTEASTPESTTSEATTSQAITSESTTSEATTSEATTSESTTSEATASQAITSESTTSEATTSEATTSQATTSEASTSATAESSTTTTTEAPEDCRDSEFGCCPDGEAKASGQHFEGCGVINAENCTVSYFGCCPDRVSAALGPDNEGCPNACVYSIFGCCDDGSTPAHGPNKEGCCLATSYGCCPDNIRHARGPKLYGCGCEYSRYGCCPDNKTVAQGPSNGGCGCAYSTHGCCPDRRTPATGPNFEGCSCTTYQFGCCPDGVSIAKGQFGHGCKCEDTKFKCCSDGITPAKGPNYAGCTCDASKYGCCPDGIEEAQGETYEGCLTVITPPGAACGLEKDRGPCRNFVVKWFFDTAYGGCSKFWYGGCEGNDNRFKTPEECQDICVKPKGRDACYLPKIGGPCEGYNPMWYYDADRKQCGQFVYTGCLGNSNKFKTREECEELCVLPDNLDPCEQPKETGPCQGNFTRWYFDKETSSCEQFNYGGCKANKNNFQNKVSCEQQCLTPERTRVRDVCVLEKDPGPCPGSLSRWYYDNERGTCREFVYGGCKGNGNKFRTYAACVQRCPVRDSCTQPRKEGNCGEKLARWSFDQFEKRCMPFYYTGCGGNKNNYETIDACDSDCPPKIEPDTCLLPAVTGECTNYTLRWYHDSFQQRCRQFYYGGCGGNTNNFETEYSCKSRCIPSAVTQAPEIEPFRTEFCSLPGDHGPCNEESDQWFYDSRYGICEQFRYGGCGGNGNKFATFEECQAQCGNVQDLCTLPQVVGPCKANILKYHYDSNTDTCEEFSYGGCRGNQNNFEDKKTCEERCRKSTDAPTTQIIETTPPLVIENDPRSPACSAPLDFGKCSQELTAYYYDEPTGECRAFVYGGCDGNPNRFETEEQCERICGSFRGQDACNLRADPGPCGEKFSKFYYDPASRSCHEFLYGGCDGNANRFTSQTECESICIHREEPPVPGNRTSISNAVSNEIEGPEYECQEAEIRCNAMQCPYGREKEIDRYGCPICSCINPCKSTKCPEGERCAITVVARDNATVYESVCRPTLKPGLCPIVLNSTTCETECASDADCAEDFKCCINGCGSSCLEPASTPPPTTVPPYTETPFADYRRPRIEKPKSPQIRAATGSYVIMTCVATGDPRPTILWRKGDLLIDSSIQRYTVRADNALQIVNLHTSDKGIYTCTAENHLSKPVRIQYVLEITAARNFAPIILGGPNYRVTVSLNAPVLLPCYVSGWPVPAVQWWRENQLIPTDNGTFRISDDHSLRISKVALTNLGEYTCQAYNGQGRATSWSAIVQAFGPVVNLRPEHQIYIKYLVNPLRRPTETATRPVGLYTVQKLQTTQQTFLPPRLTKTPVIPPTDTPAKIPNISYRVPVKVNISTDGVSFPEGSEFIIGCLVEGYPFPNVSWFKNDIILESNSRVRISGDNKIAISYAERNDTGRYRCEAANEYTSDSDTVDIVVAGIYIHPKCQDNPYFANCGLIVKGKFCQHPHYAKYCCRSCTKAGQLPASGPHLDETKRKKRSILPFY